MRRLFWALLLAVPSFAHAAITGAVFANNGTPVENARVAIFRPATWREWRESLAGGKERQPLASSTTGADGIFSIETKLDGVFQLHVERDGYAPEEKTFLAGDGEVTVNLQIAPPRNGRVTANGKPVAGALVIAQAGDGTFVTARTDEKGAFTIADPKPWATWVKVVHPDFAPLVTTETNGGLDLTLSPGTSVSGRVLTSSRGPAANARVFAGGWPVATTGDDGTFTIAHLAAGVDTITVLTSSEHGSARLAENLEIKLEPSHAISGNVRGENGRLLPGVRVTATAAGEQDWIQVAVSDEKGSYRIDHCDAAAYRLSADGGDLEFESGTADLKNQRTARADLTAKTRRFFRGMVIDERKRPVAGAHVQVMPAILPVMYMFVRERLGGDATTGSDGRFRIPFSSNWEDIGTLRVQAVHSRYAAGASGEFAADQKNTPVTITLHDGIEVRGVVTTRDGTPLRGAGVVLIEDPFGTMPLPIESALAVGTAQAFTESDAEGKFSLRLNRAVHDISVWKEGYAPFHVTGLTPEPGRKPIDVVLERGVEISGRIKGNRRKQSNGVEAILATSAEGSFAIGKINEDRSFVIPALTAGTYTVQYTTDSAKSIEKIVQAPASDVVLELPATGEIHGRVTDKETGRTLPRFSVQSEMGLENYEDVETFTVSAAAGLAGVTVAAPGYLSETQQVTVDLEKPANVTFTLARGRTISGRVTSDTGLGVADANVSITSHDTWINSVETADDGEFEFAGAPRETVTLSVSRRGFVTRSVEVEGDTDKHVNVVLSAGRKASGRVVTSTGAPVEGANVSGFSTADSGMQMAKSAADGTFTLEGLSEGKYYFQAMRADLGTAQLEDVDPAVTPIVLTFPPSKETGSIHGTVKGFTEGSWMFGGVIAGAGATGMIRRDGTYRIENLAAGETELHAQAMNMRDQMTSAPVTVTVVANEDTEVNLAFRTDIVLRGTVTQGGRPVQGRAVSFMSEAGMSRTMTGERGTYEMTGLEPGLYSVSVETSPRTFNTRHPVNGSETFDIAIEFAQLHGRVVDETGAPQAGAMIEVKNDETEGFGEQVVTDGNGTFSMYLNDAESPVVVSATKKGFATAVEQVRNIRNPVLLRLVRTNDLHVRLLDAANGRTLEGDIVASNEVGPVARASEQARDGSFLVPLPPGTYLISASADGYASKSVRVSVPLNGELKILLTPASPAPPSDSGPAPP